MNSLFSVSNDEGDSWSPPRELPLALTGDRFLPRYAHDGRLVIIFRPFPPESDWNNPDSYCTAWVGTYDDIVHDREGQYLIKLLHSHRGADHTYSGLEILPDGTFVATTYIQYQPGEELQSIVSVRFRLDEIDLGNVE